MDKKEIIKKEFLYSNEWKIKKILKNEYILATTDEALIEVYINKIIKTFTQAELLQMYETLKKNEEDSTGVVGTFYNIITLITTVFFSVSTVAVAYFISLLSDGPEALYSNILDSMNKLIMFLLSSSIVIIILIGIYCLFSHIIHLNRRKMMKILDITIKTYDK